MSSKITLQPIPAPLTVLFDNLSVSTEEAPKPVIDIDDKGDGYAITFHHDTKVTIGRNDIVYVPQQAIEDVIAKAAGSMPKVSVTQIDELIKPLAKSYLEAKDKLDELTGPLEAEKRKLSDQLYALTGLRHAMAEENYKDEETGLYVLWMSGSTTHSYKTRDADKFMGEVAGMSHAMREKAEALRKQAKETQEEANLSQEERIARLEQLLQQATEHIDTTANSLTKSREALAAKQATRVNKPRAQVRQGKAASDD